MNCFAFDIETVPDVEFGKQMWDLQDLSEKDIGNTMMFKQKQKTNSEFLPLHQHRIVAISVALRTEETFKVWSLGDPDATEREIVQRFFDGIERYTPDLLSWNGVGFDLHVLHYRALKHGVQAQKYWDVGKLDNNFRYNNYLSRYHARHIDLMDVLSGYQPRARASLDQISIMLGFPGKLGMSGDKVWPCWLNGGINEIRNYCETDVINTFLVYLKYEFMRGNLSEAALNNEFDVVRNTLAKENHIHLNEFLNAWNQD